MSQVFHLKGLNGLRAIAAFAVVFSHCLREAPMLGLPPRERGLMLAGHGVTLFFAISGFLITYLLLLEKTKTNTVNIRSFYIRRILRIWPLYYFYLIVALLAVWFYLPGELTSMIPFYVLLCANVPFILGRTLPFLDHYWSLGVEEQFYIFWPWVVRRVKQLEKFLVLFVIGFFLLKVAAYLYLRKTGNVVPYQIAEIMRFGCMAIGGLGAYWAFNGNKTYLRFVYNRITEIAAWAVILVLALGYSPFPSLIGSETIAIVSVILIMNSSAERRKLINLDNGVFDFLGKISYGIYVYHPLVIFFTVKLFADQFADLPPYGRVGVLIGLVSAVTIFIAWVSFTYFEKPFLKLKDRFAVVKSRSSLAKEDQPLT